jgi:hypothetical protein
MPPRAPHISYAEIIGPETGGSEYDSDDSALGANPAMWQHALVVDRTKRPDKRFDPISKDK